MIRLAPLALIALTPAGIAQLRAEFTESILPATTFAAFGRNLDVSGDRMVVGGVFGARVFRREAGSWIQEAELSEPVSGFGLDVAIDGDRIVVAAEAIGDAAVAFVYERVGQTWPLQQQLDITAPLSPVTEGRSVDIDGDRIVFGVPRHFVPCLGSTFICEQVGSAYVFDWNGTEWIETAILQPETPGQFLCFGVSVAVAGDVVAVGANDWPSAGAGHVFELDPQNGWEEVLVVPFAIATDGFQRAYGLDVEGDVVVFGTGPNQLGPGVGILYVVERNGNGDWELFQQGLPSDAFGMLGFGSSVSINGNRLLIGAERTGLAVLLEREPLGWQEKAFVDPVTDPADNFGFAVHLGDDELFVGVLGESRIDVFAIEPSPYPATCFGNGGEIPGCTPCTCLNEALPITGGGCLNTDGASATLTATGVASLAADTLEFQLRAGGYDSFALLVSGGQLLPNQGPCPAGTGVTPNYFDGLRCVGNGLIRHGVRSTDLLGATDAGWTGVLAQLRAVPGQLRHFQVVYRQEVGQGCGTGYNTTNAISVTVQP